MGVFKDASVGRALYFRIRCYIVIGSFLLCALLLISAFAYLPILHFQSVAIRGLSQFNGYDILQSLQASALRSFVGHYFGTDSMLTWMFARPVLPANIPLASIHITTRMLSRELLISVVERERAMIWCPSASSLLQQAYGGQVEQVMCVWVDNEGIVLGDAPSGEGQLVPTVFDDGTIPFVVGQRVIIHAERDALFSMFEFLKASGITATRIALERATGDVRVLSDIGHQLFFNLRHDIRARLPSLEPLRSSGVDFTTLQYIDLRVPSKVYYR